MLVRVGRQFVELFDGITIECVEFTV